MGNLLTFDFSCGAEVLYRWSLATGAGSWGLSPSMENTPCANSPGCEAGRCVTMISQGIKGYMEDVQ